jgi:phosphatidylserine decarboxylase
MISSKMFDIMFSTRIHPKGWPFICVALAITLLFSWANLWWGFVALGACISAFMLFFFRDPARTISPIEGAIVSPADGVIVEISQSPPPEELNLSSDLAWTKVGIFLSPWNAHLNRMPVSGKIIEKFYRKGAFQHVATTYTPIHNERLSLTLETPKKDIVVCTQIAGFLARRIICEVDVGQSMALGQYYGLICFGSHVDLYIPRASRLLVCCEQRIHAGESILGFLPNSEYNI